MRKIVLLAIGAVVFFTSLPAEAAFLVTDLTIMKGFATTGEDVFNGGGIVNTQKVTAKVRTRKTFMICAQNQPGSGGPDPNDFYVQGKGDQRGWKASWIDPNGSPVSDQVMENGTVSPVMLAEGEGACFELKITRTRNASRRVVWQLLANATSEAAADGDHGTLVIKRAH
ncbi:MAG: hypothetical protein WD004_02860 [Actinomycetota bacterium]